ncbi:uncharacterized protein LOC135226945 [Macrobrachium nipponense]|uniref:uncharacterized protein LOC135226945 n=1 Tax=Macrobrachium nipponense TaxID=159736 RepID=UPI0030C861EE
MNHQVTEKWLRSQLLPNIPPESVLVMDNAPYHSVKLDKPPTSRNTNREIISWLDSKGENPPDNNTKAESLELAKPIAASIGSVYVNDKIACDNGHKVVRLPRYHCHYNAIEFIWGQIKGYVAKKNNFKMADLKALLHEALNSVTQENWSNAFRHVETIILNDTANVSINNFVEEFMINIEYSDARSCC